MVPRTSLRVAFCTLLAVSLVATIAPAGAAPPPQPLCDACGESFEQRVEDRGVAVDGEFVTYPIDVVGSTAEVRVRENGTATWIVRNRLDDSAGTEELRSNASYRDRIADGAMGDAELLAASVSEDDVLELRYRENDFAEPSVRGTLRSGEFTSAYGYRNLDGLGADRLQVVAPEEYQVGWTVAGATVSDDGGEMTLTELDGEGIVTFVPRDAALGWLWSSLAVAELVAPSAAANALLIAVTPSLLFGVAVGVAVPLFGRRDSFVGAADRALSHVGLTADQVLDAPGTSLAAVGAATTLAMLGIGAVRAIGPSLLPLFGVGIAYALLGVGIRREGVRERASYRTLVGLATVGAVVAGAVTLALATLSSGSTRWLASGVPTLVPVFSLLPAGYALGQESRRLGFGTAAVAFGVAALSVTPVMGPGPFGGPVSGVIAVAFVLADAIGTVLSVAVVGAPLLVAGAILATDRRAGAVEADRGDAAEVTGE